MGVSPQVRKAVQVYLVHRRRQRQRKHCRIPLQRTLQGHRAQDGRGYREGIRRRHRRRPRQPSRHFPQGKDQGAPGQEGRSLPRRLAGKPPQQGNAPVLIRSRNRGQRRAKAVEAVRGRNHRAHHREPLPALRGNLGNRVPEGRRNRDEGRHRQGQSHQAPGSPPLHATGIELQRRPRVPAQGRPARKGFPHPAHPDG